MKTYLVGGAVRDALLGLPASERDWVVVGTSPKQMRAQGYRPVGRDFPVFLHPETHEEYALARTERKTGPGYTGFTFHTGPGITLEADLSRRDLTINAIAQDENGTLIDPHHGQQDLEDRILRHVSPAFREDPVRVLRLARFAAKFAGLGFRVADETKEMVRKMVEDGTVRELVAERVWQEFLSALMSDAPEVFVRTLLETNAWQDIFPLQKRPKELAALLQHAARAGLLLTPRFSCAAWMAEDTAAWCAQLRVSRALKRAACNLRTHYEGWVAPESLGADDLLTLIEGLDGIRRPESLELFLAAARCLATHQGLARDGREEALVRAAGSLENCDMGSVIRKGEGDVRQQVRTARLQAIRAALGQTP